MKRILWKPLKRALVVFIFILLISTVYQYVIYLNGPEYVEDILSRMSFSGPDGYRKTKEYLYKEMGLDHHFVPDWWPFDDDSLFH
ncbi:MAG: hypothetical protein JW712_03890 [Dehalococcoidales bacterium]|nr:hypothetical protein [Dehalococcoidales bacterium]